MLQYDHNDHVWTPSLPLVYIILLPQNYTCIFPIVLGQTYPCLSS